MATLSEQVGSAESGKTVRPVVAALKSIAA
jgi:hypothetical protein